MSNMLDELKRIVATKYPEFTSQVFVGYKNNYNPLYGAVSMTHTLNKAIFTDGNGKYLVFLPEEIALVESAKFNPNRPFRKNTIHWRKKWDGFVWACLVVAKIDCEYNE